MFNRHSFGALLLAGLLLPVVSCGGMNPSLTSIVISPTNVTTAVAPLGIQQGFTQFSAIGYYSHPNHAPETKDITDQVAWASSNPQVATITNTGLATVTGPNPTTGIYWVGSTTITASAPGFNGDVVSNAATFNVTPCTICVGTDIVSVAVTPSTQAVTALNVPIQFEAIGTTVSGATVALNGLSGMNWVSSSTNVATINAKSGLAETAGSGTTSISATFTNPDGTAAQGTATLTVTTTTGSPEPLTAMTVAPNAQTALAIGQTAQFLAIATTNTGTSVNLTNQGATVDGKAINPATWTSSNPSVATVDPATGIARSVGAGAAVITAIAYNPDGSVVTGAATYTVSVSTSTSSEPLVSLAIVPNAQTALAVNQTAHFLAIGTTGSGTTVNLTNQSATIGSATVNAAVWSSSNPSVATVDPATGIATAVSAGVTAIVAIATNPDGSVVTGSAVFTVTVPTSTEPLVSLAIVPASQTLTAANQTAGLIAIGTTGTGTTVNLTNMPATIGTATIKAAAWASSVSSVASINSATGVATAAANGVTAITAVAYNPDGTVVTATATVTVSIAATAEPLASLAIVPSSQTLTAANQTAGLIAIGTTSSGTTVNLTGVQATIGTATIKATTWSSSVPSVASINAATGSVTAVANGVTAITAMAVNPDGTVVTGTATVSVNIPATPEGLQSLTIVPAAASVASVGQQTQFLAIGNFSTNSPTPGNQNMANVSGYTVAWYSSNTAVATINSTSGLATSVGLGATAITVVVTNNADKSGATATATFTVTGPSAERISALTIFPGSQSITLPLPGSPLQTAQFIAIGTNGTTGLQTGVTTLVAWSSTNPLVATIDATGVATALSQGQTTITAVATNTDGSLVTATATLTVAGQAAEPLLSITIYPGSQSVASPGQTSQLTAIGTFSAAPATQNLTANNTTYPIRWTSSDTSVATVGSPEQAGTTPGLVKAVGQGTAAILAIASNPDGSVVTGIATFAVNGGTSEPITALTIYPSSIGLTGAGQTGQFVAIGTSGLTGLNVDVTNSPSLQWSATVPTIAEICPIVPAPTPNPCTGSNNGLVIAQDQGSTSILAKWTNPDTSVVTAQASVGVSVVSPPEPLIELAIVPSSITVDQIGDTGQFLAFGTYSVAPFVRDLTNQVTWISTTPIVFPINGTGVPGAPAGVVTAEGVGTDVIVAEATNPDLTVVTATATFTCDILDTCEPAISEVLATLTVFNAGFNQTSWLLEANSATGTLDVIHCGPGSQGAGLGAPVCYATYPIGTTVTITAPAGTGQFGGWSSNCTPTLPVTAAGPNQCQVIMTANDTVGAISN